MRGFAVALCLIACAATQRGTIGAVLSQNDDGRVLVRAVPAGLAAAAAGMQPGDEILLIDGRDVRTMKGDAVHHALAGDVGEPVKLTLVRGERVLRVTLLRSRARRSSVAEKQPDSPADR